jgi:hypothetical protein
MPPVGHFATVSAIEVAPPPSNGIASADLLAFAVAILCFLVAAAVARRRSFREIVDRPSRASRIMVSAATLDAGIAIMVVFPLMGGQLAGILQILAMVIVVIGVVAVAIFAVADLIAGFFNPVRNRLWLFVGALAFPLLLMGVGVGILLLLAPERLHLGQRSLASSLIASAAGLIWWSFLPPQRTEVARVFN